MDPAIKKFRQSMFKRVHKEERDRRKAVKASKPGKCPNPKVCKPGKYPNPRCARLSPVVRDFCSVHEAARRIHVLSCA